MWIMKIMLLCDSYIVEFIHDATENYYERGTYAFTYCNNIKFSLYVLKVLKLCLMKMIFFPQSFDEKIYYDESMPPIYDHYCDDTYALNNNDNHETCHLDLNFQSHDSYFVEFAPTIIH